MEVRKLLKGTCDAVGKCKLCNVILPLHFFSNGLFCSAECAQYYQDMEDHNREYLESEW